MKLSTVLCAIFFGAAFSGAAFAQTGAPVAEAPKAEASEASPAATANAGVTRVVNLGTDQSYVNIGEFERVKFVADGSETVIAFYGQGAEQVDVGGKQMTVYVSAESMYSSPGQ